MFLLLNAFTLLSSEFGGKKHLKIHFQGVFSSKLW